MSQDSPLRERRKPTEERPWPRSAGARLRRALDGSQKRSDELLTDRAPLEPGVGPREIFLLRRRVWPAERGVAVREAAEALDDLEMRQAVADIVRILAARAQEFETAILVVQVLAVLERQVEENALVEIGEFQVEVAIDRPGGDGAGGPVGREGAGGAAKEIARKLVEREDEPGSVVPGWRRRR